MKKKTLGFALGSGGSRGVAHIGFLQAELAHITQMPNSACQLGAGIFLLNLLQNPENKPSQELIQEKLEKVFHIGFRNLPQGMIREMALPRYFEIVAVFLRLRDYGR